jgi:hypothetical protein
MTINQNGLSSNDIIYVRLLNDDGSKELVHVILNSRKISFGEANDDIAFDNVSDFKFIESINPINAKDVSLYVGIFIGVGSVMYNFYVYQNVEMIDVILTLIVTGGIWGGLSYLIMKAMIKVQPVYEIQANGKKYKIIINKSDESRLLSIFNTTESIKIPEVIPSLTDEIITLNTTKAVFSEDSYNELLRLKSLLDQDVITEEEFNEMKRSVLSRYKA